MRCVSFVAAGVALWSCTPEKIQSGDPTPAGVVSQPGGSGSNLGGGSNPSGGSNEGAWLGDYQVVSLRLEGATQFFYLQSGRREESNSSLWNFSQNVFPELEWVASRFISSVGKAWEYIQRSSICFLADNEIKVHVNGSFLQYDINGRWSICGGKKTLKISSKEIPLWSVKEGVDLFFKKADTTFEVVGSDVICQCDVEPLFTQVIEELKKHYAGDEEYVGYLTNLQKNHLEQLKNAKFVLVLRKL